MQKKNNNGKIVFILVIAIIAFSIGAVVGITMGFNQGMLGDSNITHEENITYNMTTNLSIDDISAQDVNFKDYNSFK